MAARALPRRGEVTLSRADGSVVCSRCTVAATVLTRTRGLLGRSGLSSGEGLLLRPGSSIHTFFMRFPIDIVFLDGDLAVRKVVPDVGPWRLVFGFGSRAVLELPAGECERRGLAPGDRLVAGPAS